VPRRPDGSVDLTAVRAAGFEGYQGDIATARSVGWPASAGGRVNEVGKIDALTRRWKDDGYDCSTLHVGWGHEDDELIDRLIDDILSAEARHAFPLFIETHRATITQDTWRTVQMVGRHPTMRFNADFSHWYTGLEMPYGDFTAKLDFLEPVFARVGFFHGRIGTSGHMQAPWDDPGMPAAIAAIQEMWTRSMLGFLRRADPGEVLPFCCELLRESINYQPRIAVGDGRWIESGDRWAGALRMADVARAAWQAAVQRASRT
jgi:hypothetical protein